MDGGMWGEPQKILRTAKGLEEQKVLESLGRICPEGTCHIEEEFMKVIYSPLLSTQIVTELQTQINARISNEVF